MRRSNPTRGSSTAASPEAGTRDALLFARLVGEQKQIARVVDGLARRAYLLPWRAEPPVGVAALSGLVS